MMTSCRLHPLALPEICHEVALFHISRAVPASCLGQLVRSDSGLGKSELGLQSETAWLLKSRPHMLKHCHADLQSLQSCLYADGVPSQGRLCQGGISYMDAAESAGRAVCHTLAAGFQTTHAETVP